MYLNWFFSGVTLVAPITDVLLASKDLDCRDHCLSINLATIHLKNWKVKKVDWGSIIFHWISFIHIQGVINGQNLVTQKNGETRDVWFNLKTTQKNKQAGSDIRNFLRVATLAQRTGHIRFKRDCFFFFLPYYF